MPQRAELVDGRVLQPGVHPKRERHTAPDVSPAGPAAVRLDRAVKTPRTCAMPTAPANGIELWYETIGDPDDVPLLLVSGLGSQGITWADDFCKAFVREGFYVIRFDNRDVGLSTKIDSPHLNFIEELAKGFSGEPVNAVRAERHGGRRRSACSTTSASSRRTSSARRWAG